MAPAVKNNKKSKRNRQTQVDGAQVIEQPQQGTNPDATSIGATLQKFKFPFVLTFLLALISLTPRAQENPVLRDSVLAAALFLLLWQLYLGFFAKATQGKSSSFGLTIALRPQHYIQAMVQFSVYAYWGYYWQPVYDHALLIVAQLLFAFSFDLLLSWSRGRRYSLGFGPFPIIFSINLFLWFRDDWFYMQFLMVAMGFMGKEYVRWMREGKSVHIFNPSAFALGLFSLVLIITNTTDLTWGQEIASTLTLAPNIYTFLFIIGLIVMYFFSITLVAGAAAITLFGLSALYSLGAGVPYFIDSEIPAAVFLGLHLLITDPSTSPRTPLGKTVFGVLYGLGVFALYSLLGALGVHTFYDKLLCVPLLNLSVIAIDRAVRSIDSESLLNVWKDKALGGIFSGKANLAHMSCWIVFFAAVSVLGKTDAQHIGDSMPFWQQACADQRPQACQRLLQLQSTYCNDNSAWSCNELALHYRLGELVEKSESLALGYFERSCELRFRAGCLNLLDPASRYEELPHQLDLRLMLRQGGLNLMQADEAELLKRACSHGWSYACQ